MREPTVSQCKSFMTGVIWSDLLFPKLSVRHSCELAAAYMYIFPAWVGHSCINCYVIKV